MTSAQLLHPDGWFGRAVIVGLAAWLVAGCQSQRKPIQVTLNSPYETEQIWAVAPLGNESGVSMIDIYRMADLLAQEAEQIAGIHVVPVNRVIAAMRHLGVESIATPGDAAAVMQTLGVDGMIVGTVTAYDPYPPMTLGMAIELHRQASPAALRDIEPAYMTRATGGEPSLGAISTPNPAAHAAGVFDASNQAIQSRLHRYGATRIEPDSAYGTDIYLVSMELYTKFVSYRLLRDLLNQERMHLQQVATHQETR